MRKILLAEKCHMLKMLSEEKAVNCLQFFLQSVYTVYINT